MPDGENPKKISSFYSADDPLVREGVVGRCVSSNPFNDNAHYIQYDFSGVSLELPLQEAACSPRWTVEVTSLMSLSTTS